jgi:hypothetical protein
MKILSAGALGIFLSHCATGAAAVATEGRATPPSVEDVMAKNTEPRENYIDDPYPENICVSTLFHFRNGRTMEQKPCPDWLLSPDGNYAALSGRGNERGLFIVAMDSGTIKRHVLFDASTVRDLDLFNPGKFVWSPDSRNVAFMVACRQYPKLTKLFIDHVGQVRHAAVDVESKRGFSDQGYSVFDPVWSPDSKMLLIFEKREATKAEEDDRSWLSLLNSDGKRLAAFSLTKGVIEPYSRLLDWTAEGIIRVVSQQGTAEFKLKDDSTGLTLELVKNRQERSHPQERR